MTGISLPIRVRNRRCFYRPILLGVAAAALLCVFWFASRYPQLLHKARAVGHEVPSMAYGAELLHIEAGFPLWRKIAYGTLNWLDGMKIGMAFGVLLGALLHTTLRYYPLRIGKNLTLNSLKGALIGAPMGVCANCAVPTACGLTRGHGRVEVALGFLFSSPNFNPVVVAMTFSALPLAMGLAKYAVLLLVILVVVPNLIGWLERSQSFGVRIEGSEEEVCALPPSIKNCTDDFWTVFHGLAKDFTQNIWMLLKPTLTIMLLASVASAAILTLVPWQSLLSDASPRVLALVSLISVLIPVPIAMDVMFAAQLQQQGAPARYVMLFAMTLGTYSIIPSIYLWREVSKPLALLLFAFFAVTGWLLALTF